MYSPVVFGQKTDKNGDYIRKYLPQLRKFPSQYIYEPWKVGGGEGRHHRRQAAPLVVLTRGLG